MTVLIVDDDIEMRKSIRELIELNLEVSVLEADNGFAALEIVKRMSIHTIVTDIQMPKMDGIEFIKHVKKLAVQIPVIFQTGFANKDTAIRALRVGAFDLIEKPYKKEDLLESISSAPAQKAATLSFKLANLDLKSGQIKILEMLMNGKSNKEIANVVNLSEQGVKYHVGTLLEKFRAKNRIELRNKVQDIVANK